MNKLKETPLVKKSARTTFKISNEANKLISSLTKSYGLKPKELLDIICKNENLIGMAAKDIVQKKVKYKQTIRKSLVISDNVLKLLKKKSENYKISRDSLFEALIRFFNALLEIQKEKQKEDHERANKLISDFWSQADKLEKELKTFLDDDDPIIERFGHVYIVIQNLILAIEEELYSGKPIDPWD